MVKKLILGLLTATLLTSCVTRRLYNELNEQYENALNEKELLGDNVDNLNASLASLQHEREKISAQLLELEEERNRLNEDIAKKAGTLENLQNSYFNLERNSEVASKIEADRLARVNKELDERSKRVSELEGKIAAQEQQMNTLKGSLSKALNTFEGKGLTIEHKNGKVYVSMENKLLFNSGSWAISTEGQKAVLELGKVLAQNPDISVLIEGHTDNDKIIGSLAGGIESNWDLSTKRATTIVEILEKNPGIDKKNLTAAGRSQYAPIMSNATPEGKAKNRRIEVVLAPKLDEISKMLNML